MTNEQKKDVLRKALAETWDRMFEDFEWEESKDSPNSFMWGNKVREQGSYPSYEYTFYLAGCTDLYGNTIDVEYNPEEDMISIYIKDRPIQAKFKDDIVAIFEKYSPFNMELSFGDNLIPTLTRREKVSPNGFSAFLGEFCKAYEEYNFLFYMITICATEWYDGFQIRASENIKEV